jgi:uncharacterized Zn finger protein
MASDSIQEKGKKLFEAGRVKKEIETDRRIHFKVIGKTDTHFVIFDKEKKKFTCDCPYFTLHGKKCSHVVAAELMLG